MPQPGKSAIQLYYSPTAAATPLAANLQPGELALNTADERLYFKNSAGTVKVLASSAATNLASPPAIGNVAPNTGVFTTLTATGALTTNGNLVGRATFSSYTPDGLFDANARPSYISTPSVPAAVLFGYQDDGSGQYNPRIGFKNSASATAAANSIGNDSNGNLVFSTGSTTSTDRIWLSQPGNLGLGVASPVYKLDVSTTTGDTQAGVYDRAAAGSSAARIDLRTSGTGASQWFLQTGNTASGLNGSVRLFNQASSIEVWRADSAGNWGLGAVPSAWGSSYKVIQNPAGSIAGFGTQSVAYVQGAYDIGAGSWRYSTTGLPAGFYNQSNGEHCFYSAPSGTAGAAATFMLSLAFGLGTTLALEGATSAAGTGIAFPATQFPSTNPNTLDDYEEGTWTPSLTIGASAAGITYSFREGRYTKTGRVYHFTAQIVLTSKGVNVGTAQVIGLPFTAGSATDDFFMARIVGATSQPGMCSAWLFGNTTSMTLCKPGTTGGPAIVTNTDLTNTTEILITGTVTT